MTIRSLFDSNRNIDRNIEKVIAFGALDPRRLKAEITEYVVTDKIEDQFHTLLSRMQLAMETGGENEIGVWVSGFYGSGKSSFTKYLGLAFDHRCAIDGTPFLKYLQDRLNKVQTRQLLSTVAQRFPAAVVMLDLASEMLAGATMADVTTVLYFKVLKWAGYSDNLTLAALERQTEKDGKRDQLDAFVASKFKGKVWADVHNDPLAVSALAPLVAHQLYPEWFPTANAFTGEFKGWLKSQDQQVQEMLDIVREKSGKQHIVFVVDEVGQYVASRDNLILNLDGLAKNLKRLGQGKVWIIATAQQTLTEDDPRASLNSPQLFKLKDRFPIQIDLESSDIKEICYRRLLAKSPAGADTLGKLFDTHGQALRQNTKLDDARYYEANFNRESFINLYPFLPAHFDILLHLLGALAKSTGGIGLRSAIKIIQDVLRGDDDGTGMADQPVGWLATTVTLYDELEKDLRRAFPSVHQAVGKVQIRFPVSPLHQDIAKSVAVLQILGNLPVTMQNVASLMQPSVTEPSRLDAIRAAVEELIKDVHVPLGEKDGRLVFQSEKLRDIAQERASLPVRTVEVKRLFNEALRETYAPLPRVNLHNSLTVTSGLKLQSGSSVMQLAGDTFPVQTLVEFVGAGDYDTAKSRMLEESRSRNGRNTIGLVARMADELDELATDIYRCQRIVELHRNDTDQEIKDYCASQTDRASVLSRQLQAKIKQALHAGSFLFRGQVTAVSALDGELIEAAKKLLSDVAAQVFDRYSQAAARVDTDAAEKFLKVASPAAITTALDPLGLVQVAAGQAKFKTDHLAIVSVRDYIDKHGTAEGQRLLDAFSADPYGWAADTTRYIVAAMLMAGEIKLRVSGREVAVVGQQAIDALKTNKSFKSVGVVLREERPSMETVGRAAARLTELIGDAVIPLEQEISKAAAKHFVRFQQEFGPLAEKLARLELKGADRVTALNQDLADSLFADASDATPRLGAESSTLYDNLTWAREVRQALDHGLERTVEDLHSHRRGLGQLPDNGIPGELRRDAEGELAAFVDNLGRADFQKHAPEFNTLLTQLKTRVGKAAGTLQAQQAQRLTSAVEDLQRIPEWAEATQEERSSAVSRIEGLAAVATENLAGLRQLLARDYDIGVTVDELKRSIQRQGQERLRAKVAEEQAKYGKGEAPKLSKTLSLPRKLKSTADIDALLQLLRELKAQSALYTEVDVTLSFGGDAKDGV